MKENKATRHNSTFLASLFCFLRPFWPCLVWAKNAYFFRIIFKQKIFYHLKTIFWYFKLCIYVRHDLNCNICFEAKLNNKHVFTIVVPVKNAFLGSCHHFQENIVLPKWCCRTKKNIWSMPKSSDLGKLRPRFMDEWI